MRILVAIALVGIVGALAGCGDGTDPNYKTEVNMSEADKQREKDLMAGQKAPGAAPERGGAGPGTLTVPGKSK
ncbi:MAG: hypothetical protein ACO1SV_19665 [Fimbriimonas sp.]